MASIDHRQGSDMARCIRGAQHAVDEALRLRAMPLTNAPWTDAELALARVLARRLIEVIAATVPKTTLISLLKTQNAARAPTDRHG
ncbi:hypothetical protein [Bradyrhizobium sp. HKCCYLRH1030]|uniref:hypothetical protein n=1 Tax=Bradyrhizobium sp. HKCCYLRH1030 TaxID=3420744 RepID=UPI003EC053EE